MIVIEQTEASWREGRTSGGKGESFTRGPMATRAKKGGVDWGDRRPGRN